MALFLCKIYMKKIFQTLTDGLVNCFVLAHKWSVLVTQSGEAEISSGVSTSSPTQPPSEAIRNVIAWPEIVSLRSRRRDDRG